MEVWLPACLVMAGLILASGFFSSSETALFYLSREELRAFRAGPRRQRLVSDLLADPDRLLTAVLFWNLLINLSYFTVSLVLAKKVSASGQANPVWVATISLVVIIVFGEVLPKSLAVVFRRRLAVLLAWPLAAAVRGFDPLAPAFAAITRLLHRVCWPNVVHEPALEADDLEQAVENSELSMEVIRQERQVLHNILDLGEISVEEVMRPRGTWVTARSPLALADLDAAVIHTGYVVLRNGGDDVDQVIPLSTRSTLPPEHLERFAVNVLQVPWCAHLAHTLQRMRESFAGFASVVNEYGETIGIVSFDDILDTVLSPEPSRARRLLRREPVKELGGGIYRVETLTTLRYLSKRLDLEYEPEPDGLVTVGGLLQERLERMPEVGDECLWKGYRFEVTEASGRGPRRVLVAPDEGGSAGEGSGT